MVSIYLSISYRGCISWTLGDRATDSDARHRNDSYSRGDIHGGDGMSQLKVALINTLVIVVLVVIVMIHTVLGIHTSISIGILAFMGIDLIVMILVLCCWTE